MNHRARAIPVAILVAAISVVGGDAPVMAAPPVPKVALIVGSVGSLTHTYISLANQAAKAASDEGAEVVMVYSPDATWPAVKAATNGASIIVYLGHGNGWPSRYRDALFPPTQNRFGLNPVAGGDNSAHQYFGEASVEDLTLVPNATWVSATGQTVPPPVVAVLGPEAATPGGEAVVRLKLVGPAEPGEYVLLLDTLSPSQGSLLAHGGDPALVRVSVAPIAADPAQDAAGSGRDGLESPE